MLPKHLLVMAYSIKAKEGNYLRNALKHTIQWLLNNYFYVNARDPTYSQQLLYFAQG
jgi:hypothetical protein